MRDHEFIAQTTVLKYVDDSELGFKVSVELDDVNGRMQLIMSLTRQDSWPTKTKPGVVGLRNNATSYVVSDKCNS